MSGELFIGRLRLRFTPFDFYESCCYSDKYSLEDKALAYGNSRDLSVFNST